MAMWKGWSCSIKGNAVGTFIVGLNLAMEAKQDTSQGQKLSRLWRAALQRGGQMVLKTAKRQ